MKNLEEVDKEIELVVDAMKKLQRAWVGLCYEKSNLLAIQRGHEASAEILTEKLIERMKQ
jgi:hypothetical protein